MIIVLDCLLTSNDTANKRNFKRRVNDDVCCITLVRAKIDSISSSEQLLIGRIIA
jgi:hypothetical protein